MNTELEHTWRDLEAEIAEQKRRADLFPELVFAMDYLVTRIKTGAPLDVACNSATALLIRCRKPKP